MDRNKRAQTALQSQQANAKIARDYRAALLTVLRDKYPEVKFAWINGRLITEPGYSTQ